MKTIKVIVTKEMIEQTNYNDNNDCAICRTLRNLGYDIYSAGGEWVRDSKMETYKFLNGTGQELSRAFARKNFGESYGDVVCELVEPPKKSDIKTIEPKPIEKPKEKVIYKTVVIDSAVKELQETLTQN